MAVIWYENAIPTVPLADVALVIVGTVEAPMVNVSVALPVPPELVAFTVTVDVPADVGVPEINPVAVLIAKPAGKPVAL